MTADTEVPISEAVALHCGEWLAIQVSRRDQNGLPIAGRVVAHAQSRWELRQAIHELKEIYIKFAGSITPANYDLLYVTSFTQSRSIGEGSGERDADSD